MSNPTPFVTIPGVTATHVLGASAVELDSGDLTLSKPTTAASQEHSPVLTLSVGKATFPLYETTSVGTVAGDERIYVFRPELGEDIKGYVRLTLPDGIREPGSEFQVLQATFEKLLIDHGLLSAAEGPNEREVTIPGTVVTHELGETSAELARGDLTLSTINPTEDKPEKDPAAVLMLKVGKAAFPLHRTTLFGTLAQDDRSYAFKPELSDEATAAGQGYVKIVLPEGVSTDKELGWLQEQFEQILIDYGLLKAGIEAAGDELGRSISEDAAKAAEAIRGSKKEWLADTPPTRSPITVSPTAHKVTTTGATATRTLLGAASSVTSAIASAASTAGAWISSAIGPVSPSTAESLSSLANAYDAAAGGIATGTSEVKNAATEAVGDVVQHEFGKDVREVGGNVGESVGNVTGAVGQVAEVGALAAAAGARGAIEEDRKMQEEQGKFTIQEQEESGEFKDVSI